jgi:hypothetical protein
MKKTELHNLVLETLDEFVNEAELKTGDNTFTIKVDVNKNPTKKGIKIQLIPKGNTVLVDPDEKINVDEKVQTAMNQRLAKYDLQVNIDPDIKQATDNPNVLGYYIPLSQFKNLILKALKGE